MKHPVLLCFLLLQADLVLAADSEVSGRSTTVAHHGSDAFGQAFPNISRENRRKFAVGNSFFSENWTQAPSSPEARDGLGPLFIARSCSACHVRDGRGAPPKNEDSDLTALLVRLSRPGVDEHGAPKPDTIYGTQLAVRALPGTENEAVARVRWDEVPGTFADGEKYTLRHPVLSLTGWKYGTPEGGLRMGLRLAPPVFGGGLLEAVPNDALRRLADESDANGDGISGRQNVVWSISQKTKLPGRFGWKANVATLRDQSAEAFSGDIGITTSLKPLENFTEPQAKLLAVLPDGGRPELPDHLLDDVTRYLQTLAPPARRALTDPEVGRGEKLFVSLNCSACHVPELRTAQFPEVPEAQEQTIRPYTDLLLHDMGPELDDGRPDFLANGAEWRTPPLWGLGLNRTVNGNEFYLHDGRARNIQEAILWHGGEGAKSRDGYKRLTKEERSALLAFLNSL